MTSTSKRAAVAATLGVVALGGLLAVDVAQRPEPRLDCVVDLTDDPNPYTMSPDEYQAAEAAFDVEQSRRYAEKLAAGCTEPLAFRI